MTLTKILGALAAIKDIDSDDVLGTVGLARRRSTTEMLLTGFGIFGAGVAVGAGVGYLLNPKNQERLTKKFTEGKEVVRHELEGLVTKGEEIANKTTAKTADKASDWLSRNGTS